MTNDIADGIIDLDDEPVVLHPDQHKRWAAEYIVVSNDEQAAKSRREELRDNLKKWIISNCDQDENGNYIYEFDSPLLLQYAGGKVYGLMAQRRVSEFIDEDRAWEIVDKYDIRDKVVEEVTTEELNFDALYALNQQGIVSDEDIDSILELKETFALMKMES